MALLLYGSYRLIAHATTFQPLKTPERTAGTKDTACPGGPGFASVSLLEGTNTTSMLHTLLLSSHATIEIVTRNDLFLPVARMGIWLWTLKVYSNWIIKEHIYNPKPLCKTKDFLSTINFRYSTTTKVLSS
jgi:hypothetical protein